MAKKEKMTLEELVPLYGEENTKCNALKKVVADLNAKIKSTIKELNQQNKDIIIDGWKCSLSITQEDKVNEERLLQVLKEDWAAHNGSMECPYIKRKEYIDEEELERYIFAGKMSKEVIFEIDKCNEKVTKETLRCSKVKEKNNG